MLFKIFLIFVILPLIELTLLLCLAQWTGVPATLAVILITGLGGSLLAKSQGFKTYRQIQLELAAGRMPGQAMIDAVMIFVAGALLITPGVLTDVLGLSLLIPPCRAFYRRQLLHWIKTHFKVQTIVQPPGDAPWRRSQVIDSRVIVDDHTGDE